MSRRATALLVAAAVAAVAPAGTTAATLEHGRQIYRGTGDRGLGVLHLTRTARLAWSHPRGGELRLLTSVSGGGQFPLVATNAGSGSVLLRAGTYRGLRVRAVGGWQITISTRTKGVTP